MPDTAPTAKPSITSVLKCFPARILYSATKDGGIAAAVYSKTFLSGAQS